MKILARAVRPVAATALAAPSPTGQASTAHDPQSSPLPLNTRANFQLQLRVGGAWTSMRCFFTKTA